MAAETIYSVLVKLWLDSCPAIQLRNLTTSTKELIRPTRTLITTKSANIFKLRLWKYKITNQAVLNHLVQFMDEILSYTNVYSQPDYGKLDSILKEAIEIVEKEMRIVKQAHDISVESEKVETGIGIEERKDE